MAKDPKLSPDLQELMDTPLDELVIRTRATSNDFGVLKDEEKAQLHKKVAINNKVAKAFAAGADKAQFFIINDTPSEHLLSTMFNKGDVIAFTKNGESHKLPIKGFKQTGSRLRVSYKADEKEYSFSPAGMSIVIEIDGKDASVSLGRATVVKAEKE